MVMPTRSEIHPVLLDILRTSGPIRAKEATEAVTLAFRDQLTDEDLARLQKDGRSSLWRNRVAWARQDLAMTGLIDGSERGVWKLTPAGERRAQAGSSLDASAPPQSTEPVESSSPSPNQVVQTMLLALLQEVTNAELPWTVEHLDDGSVALSYDGRLRVILRP